MSTCQQPSITLDLAWFSSNSTGILSVSRPNDMKLLSPRRTDTLVCQSGSSSSELIERQKGKQKVGHFPPFILHPLSIKFQVGRTHCRRLGG
ncbi:unnamed protein product [Allacma fusca]|uniref:Uncharacterized protein n=1 Tax=Allacma fusca TaxID=39272 RepID=A0A8J2PFB3_9HEXA|nr:unnamed protein product [Allacma fusca]